MKEKKERIRGEKRGRRGPTTTFYLIAGMDRKGKTERGKKRAARAYDLDISP